MGFFGRNDKQEEQLVATYGECSDSELLQMYEGRDGLTEVAQEALQRVMRQRDLHAPVPAPEEVPSDDDTPINPDHLLYMFHSSREAEEAMYCLKENGIDFQMVDWHIVQPDMEHHSYGVDIGLVVDPAGQNDAIRVLKQELQINVDGQEGGVIEDANPLNALSLLAIYDRADALRVAQILSQAGLSYFWRDGKDKSQGISDDETIAIEVRFDEVKRASTLIETKLGSLKH